MGLSDADRTILESLKSDLKFYREPLVEVSIDILKQRVSKYPIFIAYQHEVALGELILSKDEFGTHWNINATILEELVTKEVVLRDKEAEFKKVYKNPTEYFCFFVLTEAGANFVFVPIKPE